MSDTDTGLAIPLLRQFSHDLRSPINAISGTNALLLEGGYGELNEKQTRAMQRIDRNTRRALLILDQFMTYTRASAGQYDLVDTSLEPRAVIVKAADALRPLLPTEVTLMLSIAEDVPQTLTGDAAVLTRCIDALLCNAVAFTAAGTIELMVESALVIDVMDTGTGIDAETQAALFTPFASGAQPITPVPSSGCGLGLALCRALATQARGSVELVRTGDNGSHFRLQLPYQKTLADC